MEVFGFHHELVARDRVFAPAWVMLLIAFSALVSLAGMSSEPLELVKIRPQYSELFADQAAIDSLLRVEAWVATRTTSGACGSHDVGGRFDSVMAIHGCLQGVCCWDSCRGSF